MRPILLIDFGSTYTKVTAVDVENAKLLGSAAAYTTVQTDVNDGLANAVTRLEEQTGKLDFAEPLRVFQRCGRPSDDRKRPRAGAYGGSS